MIIQSVEAKIWLAIKSRLDTWTETPIVYQDDIIKQIAEQAFILVQDVGVDYSGVRPVAQDCGEPIDGRLNVSVMAPLKWKWAQHKGLASRVADLLNGSGVMFYADATVRFNGRARIIGAPIIDQAWNRCEVQIPWRCWG